MRVKINFWRILAILAVILGVAFRLVRVGDLGYFMLDEERDAFLVRRMLVDHRPLLIGGVIPGGINVGPLFFYISAIPYELSNLNPVGPAYAAALVGVLSVLAVYFIGKKLFDEKTAILATIFSGFSLLNIIYNRPWWPLTMSQLVVLVAYFALLKLVIKGSDLAEQGRTLTLLVFALIVGAQSDPSTLSLIPLSVIWLWWKRKQIKLPGKLIVSMIGIFLLAHITWFIFELRHDFLNTRAGVNLFGKVFKGPTLASAKVGPFQTLQMTSAMLYRLFIPTGELDVTKQISPAEEFMKPRLEGVWWPGAWGLLAGIFIYTFLASKGYTLKGVTFSDKLLARQILSLHFIISLAGILAYTFAFPGYVHEWMWAFMFPAFFLMTADILLMFTKLFKMGSFVNFPLVVAVVIWAIWQLTLFSRLTNIAGLGAKLKIVEEAQAQIVGRPYELRSEGQDALRYGGWRYLFTLSGNPPVKSYMDYVYQNWLYPEIEEKPEVILTILNHENIKTLKHESNPF